MPASEATVRPAALQRDGVRRSVPLLPARCSVDTYKLLTAPGAVPKQMIFLGPGTKTVVRRHTPGPVFKDGQCHGQRNYDAVRKFLDGGPHRVVRPIAAMLQVIFFSFRRRSSCSQFSPSCRRAALQTGSTHDKCRAV